MLLERKFDEDSKTVLKTDIFSLQVGFTGNFDPLTDFSNCVSDSLNFDTDFFTDRTKFCRVFSYYWVGNLVRIPKMCLKQSFSHYKWL